MICKEMRAIGNQKIDNVGSYNYGLAILRLIMSFFVVVSHFWDHENAFWWIRGIDVLGGEAVPVFFMMSFVLCEKYFTKITVSSVTNRIKRIILPHIIWTGIYWLVLWALNVTIKKDNSVQVSDVFWQLLTGHSREINPSMWYQIDLFILTMLLYLIYTVSSNSKAISIILLLMMIIAYYLQYAGINYGFFSLRRYEVKYTLGRIAEMIPFMVAGIIIVQHKWLELLRSKKKYALLAIAILTLLVVISMAIPTPKGFYYSGIAKLLGAIDIFVVMYLIPFEKMPTKVCKRIVFFSKYTLGIYCSHRLVAYIIKETLIKLENSISGTMFECFFIFLLSFVACWIISLVAGKWEKYIVE